MTDMTPFDVATHWPWFRSNLLLERLPAEDRALNILALEQVNAGGQPVVIGLKGWATHGLTPGEGRAAARSLRTLEIRGVVYRRYGASRKGHAWSFTPNVREWRRMPWVTSGRDADGFVSSCRCRAPRLVGAQSPGQSAALARTQFHNYISEEFHYRPPGLFPVDVRASQTECAPTRHGHAWGPVDVRANGSNSGPHTVSAGQLTLSISPEANERFASLTKSMEDVTGQRLYGAKLAQRVAKLAEILTDVQVAVLVDGLHHYDGRLFFPRVVEVAEDLSVSPDVKMAKRRKEEEGGEPFEMPEQIAALASALRA